MLDNYKNAVRVFEDNAGKLTIVGERSDGMLNIRRGLEHPGLTGLGLYDLMHFDDIGMYEGNVQKALETFQTEVHTMVGSFCEENIVLFVSDMGPAARKYFGIRD